MSRFAGLIILAQRASLVSGNPAADPGPASPRVSPGPSLRFLWAQLRTRQDQASNKPRRLGRQPRSCSGAGTGASDALGQPLEAIKVGTSAPGPEGQTSSQLRREEPGARFANLTAEETSGATRSRARPRMTRKTPHAPHPARHSRATWCRRGVGGSSRPGQSLVGLRPSLAEVKASA